MVVTLCCALGVVLGLLLRAIANEKQEGGNDGTI